MTQELDWPAGFDRTNPADRTRNNRYEATLRDSIDDLEAELGRVGVDDWRLSTAARHQKRNPKYPYADANPSDPSAVVRWSMDGAQYAVACDAYSRLRDNVRTLYLYVREKRKMEQRPVVTGESEFANARLPPGDSEADAVVARRPPHELLDVAPDAAEDVVKAAARQKLKEHHPDRGGDREAFQRVQEAREAMLSDGDR
ncbi:MULTISPECIES: J domain-containing protein [Halorussus]|uniref:J domain-containing protein n=1 Tax=Halorussus TaxID=1070314 RepID=UPI00209E309F|nr:J domain-containing protein [Halorussus vallis]USZ77442.1 J domain-containing protein [Halorussus vallis]